MPPDPPLKAVVHELDPPLLAVAHGAHLATTSRHSIAIARSSGINSANRASSHRVATSSSPARRATFRVPRVTFVAAHVPSRINAAYMTSPSPDRSRDASWPCDAATAGTSGYNTDIGPPRH